MFVSSRTLVCAALVIQCVTAFHTPLGVAQYVLPDLVSSKSRATTSTLRTRHVSCERESHHTKGAVVLMAEQEQNKSGSFAASSILSALCPLLKLFGNPDPTAPRSEVVEITTTSLSTLARLPWGRTVSPVAAARVSPPPKPLRLYEFEACPFCRRVRDTMTYLDLPFEVRPCPKGSRQHRALVLSSGGKEVFPYLEDDNTGTKLYESAGWVPTILRAGRGMTRFEGALPPPPEKLELYSVENHSECRIVREALCELELPYTIINCGSGSLHGNAKLQETGGAGAAVPYLRDYNTGTSMSGRREILEHLFSAYSKVSK